jgi:hypothetical protein
MLTLIQSAIYQQVGSRPCVQVVPGKADKKPDSHEHALQAYSNGKEVPYR